MSVQKVLKRCLRKLSKEEFKEFVYQLLDREEHPKVHKKQVEGKDYIDVAKVMVSVFSKNKVLKVAVEILKEAKLNKQAKRLGKSFSLFLCRFKYKMELIKRVTETEPLLDPLCHIMVLSDHSFSEIKALMSELLILI
uniref:Pyrin domain-containing protein n=1 Tax=Oryzias melastigma TaxID=30732 RepID=A0A3B3CMZ9_ORYME